MRRQPGQCQLKQVISLTHIWGTCGPDKKAHRMSTLVLHAGMQSAALGFMLAQKHFAAEPMVAIPSAVSVVFMAVGGSALAVFWRNKPIRQPAVAGF